MLPSKTTMKQVPKQASPTSLRKQTVLLSPPPRQLEPLPGTAETKGSLLIKDCLHPHRFHKPLYSLLSIPFSSDLILCGFGVGGF